MRALSSIGRGIGRGAAAIAAAAGLSRLLGLARDMVLAYVFGAGPIADAFFTAFRLPNIFRRFFAEGSASMALTPALIDAEKTHGAKRSQDLARGVLAALILLLGAFVLWGEIWAPSLSRWLAPGFAGHSWQMELTVDLVRLCLPYVLLVSGAAWCMAVLNAHSRFLAPALAPAILNVTLIAAALTALHTGWLPARTLAWSLILAGALQILFQLPALRRAGFRWFGRWDVASAWPILRRMCLCILAASSYQLTVLLASILATRLPPGRVSAIYYADRLTQLPLGVFAVALGTAALPAFSILASQGREDELRRWTLGSLQVTLFVSLPATAGLIVLARPIVETLFAYGAFGAEAVELTTANLSLLSLGIPAFSLLRPLLSFYSATGRIREAALASIFSLVVCLTLGLWLPAALDHMGLALAVAAAGWTNSLLLLWRARSSMGWFRPLFTSLCRLGGLSFFMSLAVRVGWMYFLPHAPWSLILLVALGIGIYLLAARGLNLTEWRSAREFFFPAKKVPE